MQESYHSSFYGALKRADFECARIISRDFQLSTENLNGYLFKIVDDNNIENKTPTLLFLRDLGANLETPNAKEQTILHRLAICGDMNAVGFLLAEGVSSQPVDEVHKQPLARLY